MKLRVYNLSGTLLEEDVDKIVAEAADGSFCLLPRHIDFVAALVPGILSFERADTHAEEFIALDEGVLVKCGTDVTVSTRKAVRGSQLEGLVDTVRNEFLTMTEQEKKSRSILSKLETDLARRIFEMRD